MNRRNFLKSLAGLAALPFVKVKQSRAMGGPVKPGTAFIVGQTADTRTFIQARCQTFQSGGIIKVGQVLYMSEQTGTLFPYEPSSGKPPIGMAARDIAKGEIVELRSGGNTKDIITKTT